MSGYDNRIFIDIPYTEIEKAYKESQKKKGTCELIPHSRFTFDFVKDCGFNVRRVNDQEDGNIIRFEQIVCVGLGGRSTGTAAPGCKNCLIHKCKHKKTRVIKCDKPRECGDKEHIKCLDCGTYVDLQERKNKALKGMAKFLKDIEKNGETV